METGITRDMSIYWPDGAPPMTRRPPVIGPDRISRGSLTMARLNLHLHLLLILRRPSGSRENTITF